MPESRVKRAADELRALSQELGFLGSRQLGLLGSRQLGFLGGLPPSDFTV